MTHHVSEARRMEREVGMAREPAEGWERGNAPLQPKPLRRDNQLPHRSTAG